MKLDIGEIRNTRKGKKKSLGSDIKPIGYFKYQSKHHIMSQCEVAKENEEKRVKTVTKRKKAQRISGRNTEELALISVSILTLIFHNIT